jgi:hypothetical protein
MQSAHMHVLSQLKEALWGFMEGQGKWGFRASEGLAYLRLTSTRHSVSPQMEEKGV